MGLEKCLKDAEELIESCNSTAEKLTLAIKMYKDAISDLENSLVRMNSNLVQLNKERQRFLDLVQSETGQTDQEQSPTT